jgi:hypothetical protein
LIRRLVLGFVVAAGAMCLLTGCDPALVPQQRDRVSLDLVVSADGDANVRLGFGDGPEAERLIDMATNLDAPVFGSGRLRATIDGNGAGYPFLVLRADGVFQPGSDPSVRFDLRRLCQQILDLGYVSIDATVSQPRIPHDWAIDPADSWTTNVTLDGCDRAPFGMLDLRPQPARWLLAVGLLGVCLAANLLLAREQSRRRHRRRRATVYGTVAMLAAGAGVLTGAAGQGDNLVASGWIDGGWIATALSVVPIGILPLGGWALAQTLAPWTQPKDDQQTAPGSTAT